MERMLTAQQVADLVGVHANWVYGGRHNAALAVRLRHIDATWAELAESEAPTLALDDPEEASR